MPIPKDVDPTHLAAALAEAQKYQARKDVESTNLSALESLLDLPLTTISVSAPSPTDISLATLHLQLFLASDYDELIDERRRVDKCGYILCSKAPKRNPYGGLKSVVGSGKGAKVVEREAAEAWCSAGCKMRAVYVKAQLGSTPGWLRGKGWIRFRWPVGDVGGKKGITEMESVQADVRAEGIVLPIRTAVVKEEDKLVEKGLLKSDVVEREGLDEKPAFPSLENGEDVGAIEGHVVDVSKLKISQPTTKS
ncbi:hypothetical protein BT63DRAFT_482474 [Microthyrium microscopicum]|uniref:RNA polymerase II subunit B1 CTD phosphatase RPAP2 homolog n=1 Tax=Microthyrium microscopicum TaxID=703497 RepID=A0A6A6TZM6_9PEZI|nr:hypothetical protein BT63DRAFT_482474 [Microthyrium microscopicum]